MEEADAVTSPLLNKPAPNFKLHDLSGRPVSLADFRGQAVLINFWATWCAPCQVEMPWFITLQQKYAARGFTVLGIDKDYPEDLPKVPGFAKKMNLNYPVLLWRSPDLFQLRLLRLSAHVLLRRSRRHHPHRHHRARRARYGGDLHSPPARSIAATTRPAHHCVDSARAACSGEVTPRNRPKTSFDNMRPRIVSMTRSPSHATGAHPQSAQQPHSSNAAIASAPNSPRSAVTDTPSTKRNPRNQASSSSAARSTRSTSPSVSPAR